jgi:glutamate-5-semialdehyde dehydrogenase
VIDLNDMGQRARRAARTLALASTEQKNAALHAIAAALAERGAEVLAANQADLEHGRAAGLSESLLDRMLLTEARLEAIAADTRNVAQLPDPVGEQFDHDVLPNGLRIHKRRVPLGVVGVIYESRPNVTADAAALCLKAGNAAILRGGSESHRSNRAIHAALTEGLRGATLASEASGQRGDSIVRAPGTRLEPGSSARAALPEAAIALVPTRDRAAVGMMLAGLDGALDVIVPRGGKSLVARVQAEARVPVFAHLEGICHVYVDKAAPLEMAKTILLNAKMRRTGVCGAAETLLVDRAAAPTHLAPLVTMLLDAGCEVRGDEATRAVDRRVKPASEEDWSTEYLDAVISAKVVDGVDAAIAHVERYGSHHTDSIVTEDPVAAEKFLREVDSAIVLHNASTQFADGGEFGFGAEIGIATGRFHARGPVGVEQLTSFKYRVRGSGQIRP